MKNLFVFSLGLLMCLTSYAQERVWVFLTDKGEDVAAQLAHPESFLSETAIARKASKGINIDETDVPVNPEYVSVLQDYEVEVLTTSRWLNAVAIETTAEMASELKHLCFVQGIRPIQTLVESRNGNDEDKPLEPTNYEGKQEYSRDYGEALLQNEMINIPAFHDKGFTGKGVRVAIFDSGFDGTDTIDVFKTLWENNQIETWYDFVDGDTTLFRSDAHGTQVLSTIAANIPGEMIGTAPDATFILCRTEDAGSETHQEEHNWVKAMEWVDSIGVDVIHSSLGYSEFDEGEDNYTYEDMDGNTTIITKAADLAAKKGIIVTTSAGNEGDGQWKHITAPCDADSVLCIGAVTKTYKRAIFSSLGPASDDRIKPDVVALGRNATVASPRNYVTSRDGTSFSGPIIAGMVACLRGANPDRSNMDIIQAIKLSSDQYALPDEEYGYGVPDVVMADSLLKNVKDLSTVKIEMDEKPLRGTQPKKPKKIEFAKSPKSKVMVNGNQLVVKTSSTIMNVVLMSGKQEIMMQKNDYNINDNEASFKLNYLIPGRDHYVKILTTDYEENVIFTK